jgi:hypothetical protein
MLKKEMFLKMIKKKCKLQVEVYLMESGAVKKDKEVQIAIIPNCAGPQPTAIVHYFVHEALLSEIKSTVSW